MLFGGADPSLYGDALFRCGTGDDSLEVFQRGSVALEELGTQFVPLTLEVVQDGPEERAICGKACPPQFRPDSMRNSEIQIPRFAR